MKGRMTGFYAIMVARINLGGEQCKMSNIARKDN